MSTPRHTPEFVYLEKRLITESALWNGEKATLTQPVGRVPALKLPGSGPPKKKGGGQVGNPSCGHTLHCPEAHTGHSSGVGDTLWKEVASYPDTLLLGTKTPPSFPTGWFYKDVLGDSFKIRNRKEPEMPALGESP